VPEWTELPESAHTDINASLLSLSPGLALRSALGRKSAPTQRLCATPLRALVHPSFRHALSSLFRLLDASASLATCSRRHMNSACVQTCVLTENEPDNQTLTTRLSGRTLQDSLRYAVLSCSPLLKGPSIIVGTYCSARWALGDCARLLRHPHLQKGREAMTLAIWWARKRLGMAATYVAHNHVVFVDNARVNNLR